MTPKINLLVQLLMGAALLLGMMLARRKMFKAHAICQTTVVMLNLIPILIFMLPVFREGVLPALPSKIKDSYNLLATAHAALGTMAEIFGIYVILNAGTKLLPQALRFDNWKRWMRAELALWWLVILLGLGAYYFGNVATSSASTNTTNSNTAQTQNTQTTAPGAQATPKTVTVNISNFAFDPKDLTVEAGTTVVFKNNTGRHTVVADDKSFESEIMSPGAEYKHTFEREGRVPYYCSIHGAMGGKDMAGTITVTARK